MSVRPDKSLLIIIVGAMSFCAIAQSAALPFWDFKGADAERWVAQVHQCENVRIEDGVLKGLAAGKDPFLTSPSFSIKASAGQVVEFRAKVAAGGRGELFWIPAGEKRAWQRWSVSFEWIGDGQWHEYRVCPFWQGEKTITALRLDFINAPGSEMPFEISSVRIVEQSRPLHVGEPSWKGEDLAAWSVVNGVPAGIRSGVFVINPSESPPALLVSPALDLDAGIAGIAAIEMKADKEGVATVQWACDEISGIHERSFRLQADGRFHTYNVELGGEKNWRGKITLLQLVPASAAGASVEIRSISLCDELQGPADIAVVQARQVNAVNRAGTPVPVYLRVENSGGADARNLALSVKSLPKGISLQETAAWNRIEPVMAGDSAMHEFTLLASGPVSGFAEFELSGEGADDIVVRMPVEVLPDLKMAKAEYVPQPRPVKSDYEIGALYFPGWSQISAWARIWPVAPERKPVLGWYDEASPEVVDWQIKWAVENGLSYFLVDWYWHKGYQHHDHWVKAFKQARYKSLLKFALMWANHNAAGSHSVEDQCKVARFWIDNYFNMPEYYRIDDKPVVMIWSPQNMERDAGAPGGCRKLLELSREMAREAGYKGIWFIAMKWPEASTDPSVVQGLKEMGFDMTSIYHYMDHGGRAENPRRFPFDLVAESSAPFWKARHEAGILPFLPNLSTGWDSRPWHGDKDTIIYGRTVDHFQRICRDAKAFADETGVKRLVLAPVNEWGEGSYAEPCAEFGFGMYEAVRNTFCRKPAQGWPLNYAPSDVGLGPYDLPMPEPDNSTQWSFNEGMQGWSALMGITGCETGGGGLIFTTASRDPAIQRKTSPLRARDFEKAAVRMKVPAGIKSICQLFWSSGGTPTEATSLSLQLATDGEFHDYLFDLNGSRTWRGRISYLRFDPCNAAGVPVAIESVSLVPFED